MDEEMFEKGLAKRKATLGADYVDKTRQPLTISPAPSRRP